MSQYEKVFGRPIPEGYKEIHVCAGCGCPLDDPRDCGCPAGSNCRLIRLDGQSLTQEERDSLFKR